MLPACDARWVGLLCYAALEQGHNPQTCLHERWLRIHHSNPMSAPEAGSPDNAHAWNVQNPTNCIRDSYKSNADGVQQPEASCQVPAQHKDLAACICCAVALLNKPATVSSGCGDISVFQLLTSAAQHVVARRCSWLGHPSETSSKACTV